MGLADVKLHGAQTGFLRCADEFPAWKGELHGTQTHRNIQETTNLVWKKMKLQGTQTEKIFIYLDFMVWKKILHGTQTGVSPYKPGSLVWKKIKSHGTQTRPVSSSARPAV